MPASALRPAPALVLFDIDGTLLRRAGPHHREALVNAVYQVTGRWTSLDHIPLQGMLDQDILTRMMQDAGISARLVRMALPAIIHRAQELYQRRCPSLRGKVCPGARTVLARLRRADIPTGLVTGNLTRIGWRKVQRAGLKPYLQFGSFAETGRTRAELARRAVARARAWGWIDQRSVISLIGDHPNDIQAAQANGIRSIAVATGVVPLQELAPCRPDHLLPDLRALRMAMLL